MDINAAIDAAYHAAGKVDKVPPTGDIPTCTTSGTRGDGPVKFKTGLKTIGAIAIATILLITDGPAIANETEIMVETDWMFTNYATAQCLDSNGDREVYTRPCNDGNFQRWAIIKRNGDNIRLQNVATGYCLDSNINEKVYAHLCNDGNYQNWLYMNGRLKNVATGFCLDSDEGRVYAHACNSGGYQVWSASRKDF